MKIVADVNIPYVNESFSSFGEVVTVSGQDINNDILKDATILLVRSVTPVNANLLDGTMVKFVGTATIGIDHIDTQYLIDEYIGFAHAPGSNSNSVAEYVICALLYLSNKKGLNLRESVLGIIGVGNVGAKVYKKAQAFGMQIIVNDPPKKRLTDNDFYSSMEDVLRQSDIVTIHVPLTMQGTDRTYQLVDDEFLKKMKRGASLINTSRGRVIDENALCRISPDHLNGLVVDVWDNEPEINLELCRLADIATPHIAGYSQDGKINGTEMIFDAVCSYFYREKNWHANEVLKKLPQKSITMMDNENNISKTITDCYNIIEDSDKLKEILGENADKRNKYFNDLRKNYKKRLEFSHFSINPSTLSAKDIEMLVNIGFIVEQSF